MITAHEAHGGAAGPAPLVAGIALIAAAYVLLAARQRTDPRGWPVQRTVVFLAGAALLAVAVLPPSWPFPAGDFRGHMLQHLLIGMLAPTGLALGAPVTLVLRTVPARWGRVIGRLLRHPITRVATHPVAVLVLNVGGMVVLYTTPLYAFTTAHPVAHHLVHLHFLVAGYLFAWVIAGRDPAPDRPSVPARLVLLGSAIAVHAIVSQLMYAGIVAVPVPPDQRRGGAELMYYGGDIAELLLALALVTSWRPRNRARVSARTR